MIGLFTITISSCNKYLDINDNPNQATEATPTLVLPQAIVATANNTVGFTDYAAFINGYFANAGGFAGFGSNLTYNFTTATYNGMWVSTYDNLNDYQYILNETAGQTAFAYTNAIARIMKAYNYQRLVDVYNDLPYSDALKGTGSVVPTYDEAEVIYQDLVNQLDTAISTIKTGQAATGADVPASVSAAADPMFRGDMDLWGQFANTLRLRLLVRMSGVASLSSFVSTKFASFDTEVGFLTDDAVVNPNFVKDVGKQNPIWNAYAYTSTGTEAGAGRSRIPSRFIFSFYNGGKINDPARGAVIYRTFPGTPINQLGNETESPNAPTGAPAWYTGASQADALGVLKGAGAGMPLILAADSYLLQAEANLKGLLPGADAANFNSGIEASFNYLYKTVTGTLGAGKDPVADAVAYLAANAGNPLVDYAAAASPEEKLEAIITQKYIALNFILADESWNEFRRTGYPAIANGSTVATETFASTRSISTRADRLPSRVLYPSSEFSLNPGNVPQDVNQFTSLIFWDLQ